MEMDDMEGNWEPFDVVEDDEGTTLRVHGTYKDLKIVKEEDTPKILEAIKSGWNIDVLYADIQGGVDIKDIGLEKNREGKLVIKGRVTFIMASFKQYVDFRRASFTEEVNFIGASFWSADFRSATFQGACFKEATFTQNANFNGATFTQDAYFNEATFTQGAGFNGATFTENAYFRGASFTVYADFSRARFEHPGDFSGVTIRENTVKLGLYNEILYRVLEFLTRGKKIPGSKTDVSRSDTEIIRTEIEIDGSSKPRTDVSTINTETVIDGSSNPYLKRYIDDEQWIRSWRERGGRGKEAIFLIWELTSHCGRSIGLWVGWSLFFILLFSVIFTPAPHWWPDWWWGFWRVHGALFEQTAPSLQGQPVGFLSCLYFSIVNFTTLGFGDIVAINWQARVWVAFEVLLGYVMLGGLISIFANKFARRS